MKFNDYSWDWCRYSTYDCLKNKYVICDLNGKTCKETTCPQLKYYNQACLIEKHEKILKDPKMIKEFQKIVNKYIEKENQGKDYKYQKRYIKVDGIAGGEVKYWMKYFEELILK